MKKKGERSRYQRSFLSVIITGCLLITAISPLHVIGADEEPVQQEETGSSDSGSDSSSGSESVTIEVVVAESPPSHSPPESVGETQSGGSGEPAAEAPAQMEEFSGTPASDDESPPSDPEDMAINSANGTAADTPAGSSEEPGNTAELPAKADPSATGEGMQDTPADTPGAEVPEDGIQPSAPAADAQPGTEASEHDPRPSSDGAGAPSSGSPSDGEDNRSSTASGPDLNDFVPVISEEAVQTKVSELLDLLNENEPEKMASMQPDSREKLMEDLNRIAQEQLTEQAMAAEEARIAAEAKAAEEERARQEAARINAQKAAAAKAAAEAEAKKKAEAEKAAAAKAEAEKAAEKAKAEEQEKEEAVEKETEQSEEKEAEADDEAEVKEKTENTDEQSEKDIKEQDIKEENDTESEMNDSDDSGEESDNAGNEEELTESEIDVTDDDPQQDSGDIAEDEASTDENEDSSAETDQQSEDIGKILKFARSQPLSATAEINADGEDNTEEESKQEEVQNKDENHYVADVVYTRTLGQVDITMPPQVDVYPAIYSQKPRVPCQAYATNVGVFDTYVRMKLDTYRTDRYSSAVENIGLEVVDVGYVINNPSGDELPYKSTSNYRVIDGYVYLTEMLPIGSTFYVSYYGCFKDRNEYNRSSYFNTTAVTDAVQTGNFVPDFDSDDPWNGLEIELKQKEPVDPDHELKVEERGNLGATSADAFAKDGEGNITAADISQHVAPGDRMLLDVTLDVKGEKHTYRILHDYSLNADMKDLADVLKEELTIQMSVNDAKAVNLDKLAVELAGMLPGVYKSGDRIDLEYEVYAPKELKNIYASETFTLLANFEMEQIDGQFEVQKVDDLNKPIKDAETTFSLWYYEDQNKDGVYTSEDVKYYYTVLTSEGEDGTPVRTEGFVRYDPDNKDLVYTIDTTGGKLKIDYAMLEGIIYYLQEVASPEGYALDKTIYIICDSKDKENAIEKLKDADIEFSVTDEQVDHKYAGAINAKTPLSVEIVNKAIIEIPVEKNWSDDNNRDGIRPESITVNLFADDEKVASATFGKDREDKWKYVFQNLPKIKDGKEINYTVKEEAVDGYSITIAGNTNDGFVITNTHTPDRIEIRVTKIWDDANNANGQRPDMIEVAVLANGQTVRTERISADTDWNILLRDLFKNENGEPIIYTLNETAVENYTAEISGDAETGFTVRNTYVPDRPEPGPAPDPDPTPDPDPPPAPAPEPPPVPVPEPTPPEPTVLGAVRETMEAAPVVLGAKRVLGAVRTGDEQHNEIMIYTMAAFIAAAGLFIILLHMMIRSLMRKS